MNVPKKIVLLVEDSLLVLERMIPLLDDMANVEFVVHAGSYQEAVGILEELEPHLILLDLNLPDKSGIELLKLVGEKYKDIIVFVITNQATRQYRDTCCNMGARYFFDKSSELEAVPEAIARLGIAC